MDQGLPCCLTSRNGSGFDLPILSYRQMDPVATSREDLMGLRAIDNDRLLSYKHTDFSAPLP